MVKKEEEEGTVHLSYDVLEHFTADVFMKLGVPPDDADVCAEVLSYADRRGISSHGVNRLKPFYYDRIRKGQQSADAEMSIVRDGPTTAVIDGRFGMGFPVGKRSMQLAIDKAKKYGMGMVAVRNSTHYGAAGYYATMAAASGMLGITGTNARPSVAPTFGTEAMLGTNPFTIAFPTDEEFPFVLDCATSIWQRGKIEYYAREGRQVPEGLVIGEDGSTLTDSSEILKALITGKAALLPLGGPGEDTAGYKGYGYSTVVEVLSSALQGGPFLKAITGVNVGHFFMAVDISSFTTMDEFERSAGEVMRQLRGSRKAHGYGRIYTAGEKEHIHMVSTRERGAPINVSLQGEILTMRDEMGLIKYKFPFEKKT
ncbi:MAG: Ldh family oxidoreductase [Candidatus Thermoplasmatota archaeon]|jgi:LDH2 family malate/lactate/ureidoglycolate dehydrogenase|nr:Ldh family oxidoreductase [Candidatus Thermoplasmatota archaeon]